MFTCEVGGSKATAVILSICLSLVSMAAQAAEPDHFRKYIYPAEGFEAAFPSKPLEFRTENKGNPGYSNTYQAVIVNPMSQYSVFVNHSPEKVLANDSIEAYFDGSIRGLMLGSDNPALKYTKQTRVAGLPAMEYQYAHIIDGVPVITRGIIVMVDGNHMRLSQIYTEDDLGADKNFNRFISSFRLVPIDELLSNHRYENVPRGIAFSPPVGWQQESTKYPQIPVLFFSPSGHMVQVIDSGLSSYTCNNFKQEIQATQGIQTSGSINMHRHAVTWAKSTSYNPSAKIRTTTIHYCLNTSRGAVILQGMAPEATFVRSETIFRKVADSLVVRQ